MDLFAQGIQEFSRIPILGTWEEARFIFCRAAARQPKHWLIPAQVCEAIGGSQAQAVPAILATGCAHISILLVDDMLDDDPRGEYHHLGMPATSNLAAAFQSGTLFAASHCGRNPSNQWMAVRGMNEMFRLTAWGQSLDSQPLSDESAYWRVVRAKSSPFFGAVYLAGALAGGVSGPVAIGLEKLGRLYGEMIQVHDDMHDAMESPADPDWLLGRSPLPILFASRVNHPQRERFLELKRHISNPEALLEAQEILIECGAVSYCADQLIRKHKRAVKLMAGIPLANLAPLVSLLEEVIAPVRELLKAGTAEN